MVKAGGEGAGWLVGAGSLAMAAVIVTGEVMVVVLSCMEVYSKCDSAPSSCCLVVVVMETVALAV